MADSDEKPAKAKAPKAKAETEETKVEATAAPETPAAATTETAAPATAAAEAPAKPAKKPAKAKKEEAAPAAAPEAPKENPSLDPNDIQKPKITRAKGGKNFHPGIAQVLSTFNNTIVTITDLRGNVIGWSGAGKAGFKGSRKALPTPPRWSRRMRPVRRWA